MPIKIQGGSPLVCIRREAFERAGLTRAVIDHALSLTEEEFRVERDLIVVGPLLGDSATDFIASLERAGLEYFDDYFELTGNWPEWLTLYAMRA